VPELDFEIAGVGRRAAIDSLIVAGWTGRDAAAVERHIAELEALGVRRPRVVPCFYRLGANLLTHADSIDLAGSDSSGEVEFVLVSLDDGLCVGVGSDHTDRAVEAYRITVAKQMCPKPIGRELWRFDDVEPQWDGLMLRSWVTRDGARELYQEGRVTNMLEPRDLMRAFLGRAGVIPPGMAMFGGTLAVKGQIGGGERFEIELEDPSSGRSLRHAYDAGSFQTAD
jgi:hypothetical protein